MERTNGWELSKYAETAWTLYMEIMKEFREEIWYLSFGLSARNLRDKVEHFRKTRETGKETNEPAETHDRSQQEDINFCEGICIYED